MILFGNMMRRNFKRLGMCFHTDDDSDGGAGGAGDDGNGRAEIDINLNGGSGDDGGADDGKGADAVFEVPEAYKEKNYAKEIKSQDDVWKMLDNAQSLVGKKIGVPTETSTAEEIAAFNKSFGVPDTADGYNFQEDEKIKEAFGEADQEIMGEFKALLHKAGASTKQAELLREGYGSIVGKMLEKINSEKAALDDNFDAMVEKNFGDNKDEVFAAAKVLIKEHAPEGMMDYVATLPNESLIVMAGVLKSIQEKYIDEDSLPGGGLPTGGSIDSVRAEIQKVISSPAFQNPMDPGYDAAKTQWANLSKQLDALKQAKK